MREEFIPVTSALTDPSFTRAPAGRWFNRMATAHKPPNDTYQGFYILMADGYGPTRYGPADHGPGGNGKLSDLLRYMDRGLAMSREHQIVSEDVADITSENLKADFIARPDPTTSVIRQYSRMTRAPRSDFDSTPDRDFLWVYQKEVRAILSRAQAAKGEFALPATLVARLVRYHLVDGTGGRGIRFDAPGEVRTADFTARADTANPSHFTFTGRWKSGTKRPDGYDVWRMRDGLPPLLTAAQNAPAPDEDTRVGIEGQIAGEFTIDPASLRLTRFRASADAMAWGGGSPGHTQMPPLGKFPLSFAFVEADDALSRGIPPSFAYNPTYKHAWYWLMPGEDAQPNVEPFILLKPIIGTFISTVEKTLGSPRSIGAGKERYYKTDGFVRIVIKPSPIKRIAFMTFQFAPNQVRDWREALARVGLNPAGAEATSAGRGLTILLAEERQGTPRDLRLHWKPRGDSGNDELIVERIGAR